MYLYLLVRGLPGKFSLLGLQPENIRLKLVPLRSFVRGRITYLG